MHLTKPYKPLAFTHIIHVKATNLLTYSILGIKYLTPSCNHFMNTI